MSDNRRSCQLAPYASAGSGIRKLGGTIVLNAFCSRCYVYRLIPIASVVTLVLAVGCGDGGAAGRGGGSCTTGSFCVVTPPPTPVTPGDTFSAFWGTSDADIWAAGKQGLLSHWDGHAWTAPTPVVSDNMLGVWGRASTDFWAVGEHGAALYFDGHAWTANDPGVTDNLPCIWGTAANTALRSWFYGASCTDTANGKES